jgi:hypothetical protein
MELTARQEEILKAVFDNYVRKDVIEPHSIKSLNEIDPEKLFDLVSELNCQANKANCTADDLFVATITSYCRINAEELPAVKDLVLIKNIMLFVVKDKMKKLAVSPVIWTRYFTNTTDKLNEENRDLNLTTSEFIKFIHPIYWQAVKEIIGC